MSINDRRPPVVRGKWNRYLSQRVVLTAVLLFSGALCGFLLSRSSLAKINAQTTGYCDFFYTGPPISAAPIKIVFFLVSQLTTCACPVRKGNLRAKQTRPQHMSTVSSAMTRRRRPPTSLIIRLIAASANRRRRPCE